MQPIEYWHDIESRLERLVINGWVKLPPLPISKLNSVAEKIDAEIGDKVFSESCESHINFLEELGVARFLTPRLYELAKKKFGFKGSKDDQYHIARKVHPGDSTEMYRAHFDSHLFTMVLPIKIPRPQDDGSAGDIIYFPNSRKAPSNELRNLFDKAYHKRFATEQGIINFSQRHPPQRDDFQDYSPLLFVGNTTLHTNERVSSDCDSYRLTLLAHFFDPSPKFGIGALLRILRNR